MYPHSTAASTTSSVLSPLSTWCPLLSCWHCQLRLHHHPLCLCADIMTLIVLALSPLLHLRCRPCCAGVAVVCGIVYHEALLSTCQLNKGEDTYKLTAQCKHNKGKEACATRAIMPAHQGQQCQCDKGNNASATAQTCHDGGNNTGVMTLMTPM